MKFKVRDYFLRFQASIRCQVSGVSFDWSEVSVDQFLNTDT
jgi:hypothetical protein